MIKNKKMTLFPILGIIALCIFWIYKTNKTFDIVAYSIIGMLLLIISISIYFKIKSYKSIASGLNAEDEYSKRVKEKAASRAYHMSIYMWVIVVLFLIEIQPREKIIIGLGIIGMGVIYFINWMYLSKNGIPDED